MSLNDTNLKKASSKEGRGSMKKLDYTAFFKEYYPLVRAYCIARFEIDAFNADDYASDAFRALWAGWEKYASSTPPVLYSWCCKYAKSRFIDDYRRRKRAPEETTYDEVLHGDIPDIDGNSEDEAYRAYVEEIHSHLNEREKELFRAMVEESLGLEETAKRLGLGKAAAISAWYRLRGKLGNLLKQIF